MNKAGRTKRTLWIVMALMAACGLLLVLDGCSGNMDMAGAAPGGNLGARPGGAQDIGYVRGQIQSGVVPQPTDLTVEGMLAEHDLPLEGAPCTDPLCLQTAMAIDTSASDGRTSAWVQLGFSSGLDAATFHRAPLNLSVVVDHSGSMSGEKLESVRSALHRLVAQLTPADRLSIIIFDDRYEVLVSPRLVTDRAAIDRQIDTIRDGGSTDIESALARGFELVDEGGTGPEVQRRVMLFTDAMPNTGRTDPGSFLSLARTYGARHIGLTAFGVGLDFGQELILQISQVRGGSFYFLENAEKIRRVFDEDFDFLVTPIAYDLEVRFVASPGWRVAAGYGITDLDVAGGVAVIRVPTVFVSRGRGALMLRLLPTEGFGSGQVAESTIHYLRADDTPVNALIHASYTGTDTLAEGTRWFQQPGVRKAVALTNWVLAVRRALEVYHAGNRTSARSILQGTRTSFAAEVAAIGGTDLQQELALLDRLIEIAR